MFWICLTYITLGKRLFLCAISPARLAKFLEQNFIEMVFIFFWMKFGVPLDSDSKSRVSRDADGLYQTVLCIRFNSQTFSQMIDALAVKCVDQKTILLDQSLEKTFFGKIYHLPWLKNFLNGNIFICGHTVIMFTFNLMNPIEEGAAIRDVDFLNAAANPKNWHFPFDACINQTQRDTISVRIDVFIVWKFVTAEMMRLDIGPAAGQHNPIDGS